MSINTRLSWHEFSSRYSKFSKDEKSKFKKCAQIINANLLKLKIDFDHKILHNIKTELKIMEFQKLIILK